MEQHQIPSGRFPFTAALVFFLGLALLIAPNIHELGGHAVGVTVYWALAWNGVVNYFSNRPMWWWFGIPSQGYGDPIRILLFLSGLYFLAAAIDVSYQLNVLPRYGATPHSAASQR